ncbi:hypothetical protein [Pseudomonas syringae]|uniref:hypothetical protein n=1 Tax=Pseudomonas syringae TaxID=317 RepID=UPI000A5D0A58|nr:hypothetical protein [Pseudomonas syringae]
MEDIVGLLISSESGNERAPVLSDNRSRRKNPGLVPGEFIGVKSLCPKCGHGDEIKWLEELSHPREPILNIPSGDYFVPISFPTSCTVCLCLYHVPVPVRTPKTRWNLYGDEASRIVEHGGKDLSFMCLTLSCLHKDQKEIAKQRFAHLKKRLRPESDPETWVHHFTDIWSTNADAGKYNLKSLPAKIKYGEDYAALIKRMRAHLQLFVYTSVMVLPSDSKARAILLKNQKEELLKRTMLDSLDLFRSNESVPLWTFDNIQDVTKRPKREGWAEECFTGLQFTPLFVYLSAGAAVHAPQFVSPGSDLLLEVSDFVSFTIGREFMMLAKSKQAELPSGQLGPIIFNMVENNGNTVRVNELGSFALKRFFKNN